LATEAPEINMSVRRRNVAGLCLTLAMFATACADDPTTSLAAPAYSVDGGRAVTVMSRNLYLGADLNPVLGTQNPNQIPFVIASVWAAIVATDIPTRASALAEEIAQARPDLIGLQEATTYRRQSPSDFVLGNRALNANTVAYDFVGLLLAELNARGLDYRVVASVTNNDLEFPMFTGTGPLPFDDIRYTDQDVILARAGVETDLVAENHYAASLPINVGGLPLAIRRGWVAVDAEVNGNRFRFVNTHLEVQSFRAVQEAQATQLAAWLSTSPEQVVLVGDFNSAANPSAPAAARTGSYGILLNAGFSDLWLRSHDADAGLTCCQAANVRNTVSELRERLDLVLVNQGFAHFVGGVQMEVVGDDVSDRTASGLWPSDHAGVVAHLHLPAGRN
jgi:endonuclease/exonuclease/phosphatase family metal-dependent hydrolase